MELEGELEPSGLTTDKDENLSSSHSQQLIKTGIFPLPLLPDILDVLEEDSPVKEDFWCRDAIRNLQSCSRVHSTWSAPSQARLKHRIKLHPCKRNRDYELRNWKDTGVENIGPSTRTLAVVCNCFAPRCVRENRYKTLIPTAPNLRVLLLGEIALRSPNYLRLLGIFQVIEALPKLESIGLRVKQDEYLPQLLKTLNAVPRLQTLSLKISISGDDDSSLFETVPLRRFPLKSLRIHQDYKEGREKGNFPVCLLIWLLRSPDPKTIVSELFIRFARGSCFCRKRTMSRDEQFLDALQTVKWMEVVGPFWNHIPDFWRLLPRCTALQYLAIDLDFEVYQYRFQPLGSEHLLEDLPRSLEFLVLNLGYSSRVDCNSANALVEMDSITVACLDSNLAGLKNLNILVGTDEIIFPKTRERCRERGIFFNVNRRLNSIPSPWVF